MGKWKKQIAAVGVICLALVAVLVINVRRPSSFYYDNRSSKIPTRDSYDVRCIVRASTVETFRGNVELKITSPFASPTDAEEFLRKSKILRWQDQPMPWQTTLYKVPLYSTVNFTVRSPLPATFEVALQVENVVVSRSRSHYVKEGFGSVAETSKEINPTHFPK